VSGFSPTSIPETIPAAASDANTVVNLIDFMVAKMQRQALPAGNSKEISEITEIRENMFAPWRSL
jgi:hypothetical protein